jgi:ABC-type sugar transport system ATPase subunit
VSLPDGPAGGGRASPGGLVLRIENLSKHFGGARALDGVSFGVGPREVHGLLGQNGSGKSTLIKVLAGFHEPDPGARLWVGGTEVALPIPPGGFRALGISFVHQHLGLIPSLTVLENLLIADIRHPAHAGAEAAARFHAGGGSAGRPRAAGRGTSSSATGSPSIRPSR